jgi:hypothetical protein
MIEPSLSQLEREVRAARAKLATDLSTLRSPDTTAEFTETLKLEALDAKDALLDKAKSSVQSSIESLLEDIKARAAANPAASLAIAAGLGWRLVRHPPIATALIGAGLLSLFRTTPPHTNGHGHPDYLSQAKTRLMEQASEAAEVAREKAAALTETVAAKGTDAAARLKERVQDVAARASASAESLAVEKREQAAAMLRQTKHVLEHGAQDARSAAADAASRASAALDRGWQGTQSAVSEWESRDKVFLAAAGIAVATALGLAWQRRAAERTEV